MISGGREFICGFQISGVGEKWGRNYKDPEMVCLLLSTTKSLEKEKAESDLEATES